MRLFPNVPIVRRQMLIIMLTTCSALLLACAAFITYEYFSFRHEMRRQLSGLAARVKEKAGPYLAADDGPAATAALRSVMSDEPNLVSICAYRENGRLAACHYREGEIGFTPPPAPDRDGFQSSDGRLVLARRIVVNEVPGIIRLESDLQSMYRRFALYVGIMGAVLMLATLAAFVLSAWLQRAVSEPILHLAQVSQLVSEKKNYAIRAMKYAGGELGTLIDGFNDMLAQIQIRDAELRQTKEDLEKRVQSRTHDLRQEVAERARAEKALQQQVARISLLNRITHSIAQRMDMGSMLDTVLVRLVEHLPVDFGAVFLCGQNRDFILTAANSLRTLPADADLNLRPASVLTSDQAGFQECLDRKPLSLADTAQAQSPLMRLLHKAGLTAAEAVPLVVEDKLFGVLLVARRHPGMFADGEREFLRMLSEQVALAAHQARLHTELQSAYDELRQTQQAVMQQQKLHALGEMASGIVHDVNNALSPIIVYSELALRQEHQLSDAARKHLSHIKTAGEDIAHIVARMREFYRPRDANEELAALDPQQLVKQVIDMTRPRWRDIPQQRGIVIEMQTDLSFDLPQILGNASELREALTNLILNAVDAMPSGGNLTIRAYTRSLSHEGAEKKRASRVIIEVCDTGIGMDEATRSRCLEPFFSTKGYRGTGLGLAMVYGVMQRHEGDIEVESEPGKGAVFRLIFPVMEGEYETSSRAAGALQPPPPQRILCVDDEPLLRQLIREILEGDRHSVTVADGGQAGLDAFVKARSEGRPFDVVITDLGMPYLDGRQVAAQLRKISPRTPIILLTGWGKMMRGDDETPPQVDAVVSKPPRINELRDALSRVAAKHA